jgi:hypothetical protein
LNATEKKTSYLKDLYNNVAIFRSKINRKVNQKAMNDYALVVARRQGSRSPETKRLTKRNERTAKRSEEKMSKLKTKVEILGESREVCGEFQFKLW